MKFQYISQTDNPPRITEAFGYEFKLDGEPVEVKDEFAISKLKNMAHVGFVALEEDLDNLSYRDLQNIAKEKGILANKPKEDLLNELKQSEN